ncbi:lectin-like [Lissotriton helveticus]
MNACYKPVMERMFWPDAEAACVALDSHLTSVHSMEENEFIFNLMGRPLNHGAGHAYWIGGHNLFKQEEHMWTDGSKMMFTGWAVGQPDNPTNEHYIGSWYIQNGNITWNDYPKQCHFPFVCKYIQGNRLCGTQ